MTAGSTLSRNLNHSFHCQIFPNFLIKFQGNWKWPSSAFSSAVLQKDMWSISVYKTLTTFNQWRQKRSPYLSMMLAFLRHCLKSQPSMQIFLKKIVTFEEAESGHHQHSLMRFYKKIYEQSPYTKHSLHSVNRGKKERILAHNGCIFLVMI